jgi:hypothetical protein
MYLKIIETRIKISEVHPTDRMRPRSPKCTFLCLQSTVKFINGLGKKKNESSSSTPSEELEMSLPGGGWADGENPCSVLLPD